MDDTTKYAKEIFLTFMPIAKELLRQKDFKKTTELTILLKGDLSAIAKKSPLSIRKKIFAIINKKILFLELALFKKNEYDAISILNQIEQIYLSDT